MKSNKSSHTEVFECFVKIVRRNFYDADAVEKKFNPSVSAFRAKVSSVKNSFELYWNVFSPMLQRFGVSHTGVIPPKQTADEPNSNTVTDRLWDAGVFLNYDNKSSHLLVVMVRPFSDAQRQGIAAGQNVLKVGPGNEPGSFDLVLGDGRVGAVKYTISGECCLTATGVPGKFPETPYALDKVAVVELERFEVEPVKVFCSSVAASDAEDLIVDLRRNSGGYLDATSAFCGLFVGGELEIGEYANRQGRWIAKTSAPKTIERRPLALLVSSATASMAEIASYFLQQHKRALIVGTQTNGAVLSQRRFSLPDGGSFEIPVSDFVQSDGVRLEHVGVRPDLELSAGTVSSDTEVVKRAAEFLRSTHVIAK